MDASEPVPPAPAEILVGKAIDDYLRFVRAHREDHSYRTYRFTLDPLPQGSYKMKYIDDATREDVLDFMTYCHERDLRKRTVYNKVVAVPQLFKRYGERA